MQFKFLDYKKKYLCMWFISFCKYEYEHFQYGYSNFRDKVPHVEFKSFSICVDEYVVHSLRIKDI